MTKRWGFPLAGLACERGNVGMIAAFTLPVLALAIGGSVDYAQALRYKAALQNAVDSATLAAVSYMQQNNNVSQGMLKRKFEQYMKSSLRNVSGQISVHQVRIALNRKEGTVDARVEARAPTTFLKFAAINGLDLTVEAQGKASYGYTEVALVLDTTGSMRGAKIAELKRAARKFLDTIHNKISKQPQDNFHVAIVPFSQYVNVGKKYRNASWIQVDPDRTLTRRVSWRQCWRWTCKSYTRRYRCYTYSDGRRWCGWQRVCSSWSRVRLNPCVNRTWIQRRVIKWEGCVGSRRHPDNVNDGNYALRVPGVMNYQRNPSRPITDFYGYTWTRNTCPSPLQPLVSLKRGKAQLLRQINSLRTDGWTYIPAGLMWGWRVLSRQAPFDEGLSDRKVVEKNGRKIIILMTDGANTRAPDRRAGKAYREHSSSDVGYANRLTREACGRITAINPATGRRHAEIITITFNVKDATIKRLLRDCATMGSYDVGSGQLVQVFEGLARKMVEVHLTR